LSNDGRFRKQLLWTPLIDDSQVLMEIGMRFNDTGGSDIGSMRSLLEAAADRH